ncbi:hypothetical protein AAC387_Pa12g1687 [Persea americana]
MTLLSYPSDVPPPPVLMPVPGAGPLGPFVPVPPEVAMRMLRDQGGPFPYEENGGSCGRKGRSAPQPLKWVVQHQSFLYLRLSDRILVVFEGE